MSLLKALLDGGFPAVTKMDVFGRGKQRGLKVGDITYDELSKEMLLLVVKDEDQDGSGQHHHASAARTGDKGAFGDGKIFVSEGRGSHTRSATGTKDERKRHETDHLQSSGPGKSERPRRRSLRPGSRPSLRTKVLGRGRGNVDFRVLQAAEIGNRGGNRAAWRWPVAHFQAPDEHRGA